MRDQRFAVEGLDGRTMLTAVVGLLAGNEVVVFDSAAPERILARRTIAMPRGETLAGIDFSARDLGLYGITSGRWRTRTTSSTRRARRCTAWTRRRETSSR